MLFSFGRGKDTSVHSQAVQRPLTDGMYKQVISLLQLVRTSSGKLPEVSALFMDELSSVVEKGHLDAKVEVSFIDSLIIIYY